MIDRILLLLDAELIQTAAGARLSLYHVGRSALVWKHGFQAATEDIDVVMPRGDQRLINEAIRLFGRGTPKAKEYNLYIEVVPEALPPVGGGFYKRATEVNGKWKVIRLFHLEDHNFAVTKLKRFSQKDQSDIREMCDRELLDPKILEDRLVAAFPFRHEKDEDKGREAAEENIKIVLNYLQGGDWALT